MGANHGRADIFEFQKLVDRSYVVICFKQMHGGKVAEGMWLSSDNRQAVRPPPILCGIEYGCMRLLHEFSLPTDTNRLNPRGVIDPDFNRIGAYLPVVALSRSIGRG